MENAGDEDQEPLLHGSLSPTKYTEEDVAAGEDGTREFQSLWDKIKVIKIESSGKRVIKCFECIYFV